MTQNPPEPTSGQMAKRASDADRDQVVERLRNAASEGRLDLSEFEERMGAAYEARTYGELAPLTADLPDVPGLPDATPVSAPRELVLRAHGSSVRREGRWPIPSRLVINAEHGGVRLDLTQAVALATEVEVEIAAKHSSVVLLVPDGTLAVDDGLATNWSSVKYRTTDGGTEPTGPSGGAGVAGAAVVPHTGFRLRLTGEIHHSSVTVRAPTVFDLWGRRFRAWWRRRIRPA